MPDSRYRLGLSALVAVPRRKASRRAWLASCALLATLGLAGQALAQGSATPTQGAAPSGAGNSDPVGAPAQQEGVSTTIGEIVVTANKRAENLQNVAETVTAVSQDAITRQGVKDITDIARVVPEVQVLVGQFANITIRGVRTGAYGPSTDSPNAVHIDGVYLSRFTSLSGLFFDVQRVEVLDGPQGTLYGRNSAGGTLNVITNKPTREFGGYASVEYGNYDALTTNLAINVPLGDTLAFRGAYYHNSHAGYANNGTDDADEDSARGSMLWRPTSTDSVLVTLDHEVQGGKGAAPSYVYQVYKSPSILSNPATGALAVVPAGTPGSVIVPIVPGGSSPRDVSTFYGAQDLQRLDTRGGGAMGQYDHDFGWANLTFQASYRDTSSRNRSGTLLGFGEDPRLETTAVVRPPAPGAVVANSAWDSEELRLTSPSHQALTYVVGLYRFHENSTDNHNDTYYVAYPNTSAATIGQRIIQSPDFLTTDIANPKLIDDSYAVFGQATYSPPVLTQLHLTLGLRYNDEKKNASGYEVLGASPPPPPAPQVPALPAPGSVFPSALQTGTASFNAVTYKGNIAYDLTPRNMVYFDTSTGFKAGGFAYGQNAEYQPENITAYEIGTKNRFFDNRLQVNASAWHYDYRNLTATVNQFYFDPTLNRVNTILNTTNAPKSTIDGQSASIEALFTKDDIFDFNVTHLDAKYKSYDLSKTNYSLALANYIGLPPACSAANRYPRAACPLGPGATPADFNYSGTPIGNDPDWVFDTTYDHIFHVFAGQLDAQVAVHYVGNRLFANQAAVANVNNYLTGKPYATGDLSLRYQPDSRRWSLTGYVRNVTDQNVIISKAYVSNANFLPTSDPNVTFAYGTEQLGPPRTFGVILSANF